MAIASLKEGEHYKFLGVSESLKQEDKMALKTAAKKYIVIIIIIKSISIAHNSNKLSVALYNGLY